MDIQTIVIGLLAYLHLIFGGCGAVEIWHQHPLPERRETRLAILAATVIVGTVIFVCRNKDGGIEVDTAKYYLNSSSCVN